MDGIRVLFVALAAPFKKCEWNQSFPGLWIFVLDKHAIHDDDHIFDSLFSFPRVLVLPFIASRSFLVPRWTPRTRCDFAPLSRTNRHPPLIRSSDCRSSGLCSQKS